MSEVIASFEKNSMEEVRVSLTEFKGKELIDLRKKFNGGSAGFPDRI